MLKKLPIVLAVSTMGLLWHGGCAPGDNNPQKPNIIYILADDLGYGDLGCYGQQYIQTPNIDKLASEGLLFTQHYSGSTVCAPSRSVLMTGKHTGHTFIRGNREYKEEGQEPLNGEEITIAEVLKEQGYTTGAFGKWGLGMAETQGSPLKQGFDYFFGFLCQKFAHRYYPTYLWENNQKYPLPGNDWTEMVTYAPDVIQEKTLQFIRDNKDQPFFAYVPHIIPHAETVAPQDSFYNLYKGKFEETPWYGNEGGWMSNDYGAPDFEVKDYASQEEPRAVFAAMVSRLDHHVGEIMALLKELEIDNNTLVIFTSDNGPHKEGGADPDFFDSNGGLRGYKRDLYEGGIRVPMIARWPGKIAPDTKTDHQSAFWDVMPTICEITNATVPDSIDGISFLPTLLNQNNQLKHPYLYWEFHEMGGRQAIIKGNWKLVKYNVLSSELITTELYNIEIDPREINNVANESPELVSELENLLSNARTPSEIFPFIESK